MMVILDINTYYDDASACLEVYKQLGATVG